VFSLLIGIAIGLGIGWGLWKTKKGLIFKEQTFDLWDIIIRLVWWVSTAIRKDINN
jgi:hypothetical protein